MSLEVPGTQYLILLLPVWSSWYCLPFQHGAKGDHIFKFSIDDPVNMLCRVGRELKITIRPKKSV